MALPTPPDRSSNHAHVVQVAVGDRHALLLTDEGIVYSWGGADPHSLTKTNGALGRQAISEDKEREPSPINHPALNNLTVVQIACGAQHCLALASTGALFSWGSNKAGQLGLDLLFNMKQDNLKQENTKQEKTDFPQVVMPFDGKENFARSCSCGPDSSACVTLRGEVYIWGSISYYVFASGKAYPSGGNCTVPVKVKGMPRENNSQWAPDKISVNRRGFACTLGHASAADDITNLMGSLKSRSSMLSSIARHQKLNSRARGREGGVANSDTADIEDDELMRSLNKDAKKCELKIQELEIKLNACNAEKQHIDRSITAVDQQDTESKDAVARCEALQSDKIGGGSDEKILDTQLRDHLWEQKGHRRDKYSLQNERVQREREETDLQKEMKAAQFEKSEIEGRKKLIRDLQGGKVAKESTSSTDEVISIAMSKREELAAADPQTLASVGKFMGVREVLAISNRALQDVSSALKEASTAVSNESGYAIVEALEANLKVRKAYNELIQKKLSSANRNSMFEFHKEMAEPSNAGVSMLSSLV
eukprot:TRINITY_DN4174_c0_g1_i1.p1 TRINITY_DN4174_c0_g1~~TRINITY_DN4174_c0_g1_i1.p1  ORF type:complete len:538 (+),score=94.53 TRINITY_DN4174_c0_g1_i1:110-1723(+)